MDNYKMKYLSYRVFDRIAFDYQRLEYFYSVTSDVR